jgi:transcriptional regulator with GAF, ATPase, and Fis domain
MHSLRSTLEIALALTHGSAGAYLRAREHGPEAIVSEGYTARCAAKARELWTHARASRDMVYAQPYLGAPVFHDSALVGLLVVEAGPDAPPTSRADIEALARIAHALAQQSEPVAPMTLKRMRLLSRDQQREELLRMLERCDWNIKAVAEKLETTRLTIYTWIKRLKIKPDRRPISERRRRRAT